MKYLVIYDSTYSSIEPVSDASKEAYKNFTEAKKELIRHLESQADAYQEAAERIRSLKKSDLL